MTFGKYGSATEHIRYSENKKPRRGLKHRCSCGCNGKATKKGMANGVCLMDGCEMHVRRWVRDGIAARSVKA